MFFDVISYLHTVLYSSHNSIKFFVKKIILSELIRVLNYVSCAILLLKLSDLSYLYSLFISVIASYIFSLLYLIKQARNFFRGEKYSVPETIGQKKLFKSFFSYGAPFRCGLYLFTCYPI